MSAAVGAALKKVLVAILTEPKVLKNVLFAILVVVVAMILPTVFVVSIFSGDFEVDTASLQQHVEENLSAADIVLLTNVENTMEAIEEAMDDTKTSVGTELNIQHISATPAGLEVRAEAVVTAVDGKVITFEITAWDEAGEIGKGTHKRVIVPTQKFLEKAYNKL